MCHIENEEEETPPLTWWASSTTQGILHGRAQQGNVFNMTDAKKHVDMGIYGLVGKINIYNPGDDPSTVKPKLVIKTGVENHIALLLTEIGKLHTYSTYTWI